MLDLSPAMPFGGFCLDPYRHDFETACFKA